MRLTKRQLRAAQERMNMPAVVRQAVIPVFSGRKWEELPDRRQLEAAIRIRLRPEFRWDQVSFEWPSVEYQVAEALMDAEDRLALTVTVYAAKRRKTKVPFTMAELNLRTDEDLCFEYDYDSRGDSVYGYEPVGSCAEYEKDYDDHYARAFGEVAPSKKEKKIDDWEWRFAQKWTRGRKWR